MRKTFALAVVSLLSASLIAPLEGGAASTPSSASLKQTQQGLKNSKKVIQKLQARDKKMRELRKAAYAKRQQAMSRK